MKNIKKILTASLLIGFVSNGIVTPTEVRAVADRFDDNTMTQSKWGVLDFIKSTEGALPSDRIILPSLFTNPIEYKSGFDFTESTVLEGIQSWEYWIKWSTHAFKLSGHNLDPENEKLMKLLRQLHWTDEKLARELLNSSNIDLTVFISGSYLSTVTKNVYEIFENSYYINDTMYAQAKAMKLRADLSKVMLSKIGKFTESDHNNYNNVLEQFEKITHIYNGQNDPNYLPQLIVEKDADVDEQELQAFSDYFAKLPPKIRHLFVKVLVVGESNVDTYKLKAVLGHANNKRDIRLNGMYNGMVGTLSHEVGHIVDFMSGRYNGGAFEHSISRTDVFRKLHTEEYQNERPYFKDNFAEGFADGFGRWLAWKYLGADDASWLTLGDRVKLYYDTLGYELFGDEAPRTFKPEETYDLQLEKKPELKKESKHGDGVTIEKPAFEIKKEHGEGVVTEKPTKEIPKKEIVSKVEETITQQVIYVSDPTLDGGQKIVEDYGTNGVNTVTEYSDGTKEVVLKTESRPRVVKVGTKEVVVESERNTKTTTYTVDENTGVVRQSVKIEWKTKP